MTKTGISEKLRHFSTLLAASLFAFVGLCPFIGFSECGVYQEGDYYVIRCSGVLDEIPRVTNYVYVIKDCEDLKRELLSLVGDISIDLGNARHDCYDSIDGLHGLYQYLNGLSSDERDSMQDDLQGVEDSINNIAGNLDHAIEFLSGPSFDGDGNDISLASKISSINCGSCSTNSSGGGSCSCDVDFSEILSRMNDAQFLRIAFTNFFVKVVGNNLDMISYTASRYKELFQNGNNAHVLRDSSFNAANSTDIQNNIYQLARAMARAQSSINNYLYRISFQQFPNISNNLEIVMSTTTNFYNAATNHFSFFRKMIFQDSPLLDYSQQSTFDNYYDFLTNHYVKVSFKQYNDLVGDEKSKTNWFSRIETLIASLVFADSVESTNTVDSSSAESESSSILSQTLDGVDGVKDISSSQLSVFQDTSQNIISSLRIVSSSFSSVADPGTVSLVRLSSSDTRDSSDIVSFQTSDIRNLVEACHCVTTLCWCLGGLMLLYYFLHWTVKTSYGLVMFAWGVFSAIFKH